MSDRTAIVWFRRDLRLTDNPALTSAIESGARVVALYVHSPIDEGEWRPGAASRWWLHHSLTELDQDLRIRGVPLTLRRGRALEALRELARECRADAVYWNRLYEPATVARDTRIKSELRADGLDCHSCNAALLCEPWELQTAAGGPYRVFTPFWRACQARLGEQANPLPPPSAIVGPAKPPRSESLDSFALLPRVPWDAGLAQAWRPGESGALTLVDTFCDAILEGYDEDRNDPGVPGTSMLSPYLHFGEIGPRQLLAEFEVLLVDRPSARRATEAYVRQLGWREFAHHLLHHFPDTVTHPLDERFERFPWEPRRDWLEAWQQGRTGYPLVDAGMRQLWMTGWMHNRVRMIVASMLTKNLRQPWLDGARWFWDTLVDADLANNTLGWQWTAGCGADAAPYFRVFNPVLQAERYDPERTYLREWLPELAALPDDWIHRPWLAPAAVLHESGVVLGRDYPEPIVDLAESRAAALAGYASIKEPTARE